VIQGKNGDKIRRERCGRRHILCQNVEDYLPSLFILKNYEEMELQKIHSKIFGMRGQKGILDFDLAAL
jgi:hypothetical protein